MANIFFSVIAIFLVCVVIGLCRNLLDNLCDRYGGILGTIVAFVINALEFGFIFWLVGKVIPLVDWKLGLYMGLFYCAYCWIFGKTNKMLNFVFNIFDR